VTEHPELTLPDVAAWRAWLDQHEDSADGVWLVMAKKGVTTPTSLSYGDALQEALCSGWIDGQRKARDETTFLQRFTPRRKTSIWSQRNVGYVEALIASGRMRARGFTEIERAQAELGADTTPRKTETIIGRTFDPANPLPWTEKQVSL